MIERYNAVAILGTFAHTSDWHNPWERVLAVPAYQFQLLFLTLEIYRAYYRGYKNNNNGDCNDIPFCHMSILLCEESRFADFAFVKG